MESKPNLTPLIIIVGETASGKSSLSLQLAQRFNGEIICADSRTIYAGMDIATAKPTAADRRAVPHHLLDVVLPSQFFNAALFKERAVAAIDEVALRGRVPFMVGGTGLYVDSVAYDFSFSDTPIDVEQRAVLQSKTVEELQQLLQAEAITLPLNSRNPRHLIRAYETKGHYGERSPLRPNTLIMGITTEREALEARIRTRIDTMIAAGCIEEVERLVKVYGWDAPGLQAPGYQTFRLYLEGKQTLKDAKELFIRSHLQLAKRQRTWFRRNKDIHWISKTEEAVDLITSLLNK